jgi:hypothetical protein
MHAIIRERVENSAALIIITRMIPRIERGAKEIWTPSRRERI